VSDLFDRECFVDVQSPDEDTGFRLEGFRVQFKAVRSLGKHPNTCELSVTNLSREHRAALQKRHARIRLMAGYVGSSSQLFSGQARSVDNVRRGTEWETKVRCGDGERQYVYGSCSESFAPGTPVADVIRRLARISGLGIGNVELALQSAASSKVPVVERYENGFTAYGNTSTALDNAITAAGFEWSIQDGQLQLLRPGAVVAQRPVLLTSDSGLIGSPEHGAPGKKGGPAPLKVRALLMPNLRPGGRVELRTEGIPKASYRISRVEHSGDTSGTTWYSDMEVEPV
jgi:hypothetical protein